MNFVEHRVLNILDGTIQDASVKQNIYLNSLPLPEFHSF